MNKTIRAGAHKILDDPKYENLKTWMLKVIKEQGWMKNYLKQKDCPNKWTELMPVFEDEFLWRKKQCMMVGSFMEKSLLNCLQRNELTNEHIEEIMSLMLTHYNNDYEGEYIEVKYGSLNDLIANKLLNWEFFDKYKKHILRGAKLLKNHFSSFMTQTETIQKYQLEDNFQYMSFDILSDKYIVEVKFKNKIETQDVMQALFYYLNFMEQNSKISLDGIALFNCKNNQLYKIPIDYNIFQNIDWRSKILKT